MPVTLPSTRKKLRAYQDGICPLCGGRLREDRTLHASEAHWATTVDHVWPLSLGGRNGFGNILLAHRVCNSAKGGREPLPLRNHLARGRVRQRAKRAPAAAGRRLVAHQPGDNPPDRLAPPPKGEEMMTNWRPIDTVPAGQKVDVWIWEAGDEGATGEGFRFPEVEVIGEMPYGLKTWRTNDMGDVEEDIFWPHENGCFVSNWMPLPTPPALNTHSEPTG